MIRRLLYIVIAIGIGLNIVPRMVSADGTVRWFVLWVEQPERFDSKRPPGPAKATWVFGFAFDCYSRVGSEFSTKEGIKLFLRSPVQPSLASRISLTGLCGNVVVFALPLLIIRHCVSRRKPTGEPPPPCPFVESAGSNKPRYVTTQIEASRQD